MHGPHRVEAGIHGPVAAAEKADQESRVDERKAAVEILIRQALFVNLARAEVSKPLDGLKLNGIGTLQ